VCSVKFFNLLKLFACVLEWNETLFQSVSVFCVLHFIKNKLKGFFCFLELFYIFVTGILLVFGRKCAFCIENGTQYL
jgi:hypothetical protein